MMTFCFWMSKRKESEAKLWITEISCKSLACRSANDTQISRATVDHWPKTGIIKQG